MQLFLQAEYTDWLVAYTDADVSNQWSFPVIEESLWEIYLEIISVPC